MERENSEALPGTAKSLLQKMALQCVRVIKRFGYLLTFFTSNIYLGETKCHSLAVALDVAQLLHLVKPQLNLPPPAQHGTTAGFARAAGPSRREGTQNGQAQADTAAPRTGSGSIVINASAEAAAHQNLKKALDPMGRVSKQLGVSSLSTAEAENLTKMAERFFSNPATRYPDGSIKDRFDFSFAEVVCTDKGLEHLASIAAVPVDMTADTARTPAEKKSVQDAGRASEILASTRQFRPLYEKLLPDADSSSSKREVTGLLFEIPAFKQQIAREVFWRLESVAGFSVELPMPHVEDPDVRNRIANPLIEAFASFMGPESRMTDTQIVHLNRLLTENKELLQKLALGSPVNYSDINMASFYSKDVLTDLLQAAGLSEAEIRSGIKHDSEAIGYKRDGLGLSFMTRFFKNPLSTVQAIKQRETEETAKAQAEAEKFNMPWKAEGAFAASAQAFASGASSSTADAARFANT
jgi:hypothetical protein